MAEESYMKLCRSRFKNLKSEFNMNWQPHFEDLADYLLTRKGRFLDRDTTPNDGGKLNGNIIDGTGGRAVRILAAGMQSGLTSPARPWFRLGLSDKDLQEYAPVRGYLDEVQSRMLAVFSRSNLYSTLHSIYAELGCFGTSAMLLDEDFSHIIRCYPFTIGEYFLACDDTLRVNAFFRGFKMTAANIVRKFGEDNVSDYIKQAARTGGRKDAWFSLIHCIQPNTQRIPGQQDNRNMEWSSVYMEEKGEEEAYLRMGGYEEFPIMAPRWDTTGSETYGRSPGMDTLPDVKMLQKLQEKKLTALDKLVDPPMNAPAELKRNGATIVSGGVNWIDSAQGHKIYAPTYQIQPDFKAIQQVVMETQEAIKAGFYNDLFLMLALGGDKEMTAREVAERHEEKLLSIGPVVERLQPELLDRIIDRTFAIMERNLLLPEPPQELQGENIEVEYISLLAQAQKMVGMTALEQTSAFAAGLAAVWPEARHKIKAMQMIDEYAKMNGTPVSTIASDEEAEQKVMAEQQALAKQQEIDNLEKGVKGVKTLSEADMDRNSALKQIQNRQGA